MSRAAASSDRTKRVATLQKPMPRGRYALLAAAHALLLGGLLWVMVRSGFNLPPVGALACLAGMGVLGSLTAITIRRMRDAGLPAYILLAPLAWGAALILGVISEFWLMNATHISQELARPYTSAEAKVLILCGCIFMPLTLAMLSAPTRQKRPKPEERKPGFLCNIANGLAASFRFGGRATRREFWFFAIPILIVYAICNYSIMGVLLFVAGLAPGSFFAEVPISAFTAGIIMALLLPMLSLTFRRARDAGHFRRWFVAFLVLILGAMIPEWVYAQYAPTQEEYTPLALYLAAFCIYTLYVALIPSKKAR